MNENEPLEFAESSKKVAQKIDEEIDEIRTKIKKDFPARDITDLALLEKLEKKSREAWMDYADSYAREKRKYSREKGLLKEKPYRDGIMIDPKKNNPYRDGIMIDPKKNNPYRDEISKNREIEPSENEKLMAEIKKCISELLELESQTEKLKKRLNAIKKQVEITDDETKGFYKL
mgnify:FL=1